MPPKVAKEPEPEPEPEADLPAEPEEGSGAFLFPDGSKYGVYHVSQAFGHDACMRRTSF